MTATGLIAAAAALGEAVTLAGVALIMHAFGKMVKDICAGISTLWPPK